MRAAGASVASVGKQPPIRRVSSAFCLSATRALAISPISLVSLIPPDLLTKFVASFGAPLASEKVNREVGPATQLLLPAPPHARMPHRTPLHLTRPFTRRRVECAGGERMPTSAASDASRLPFALPYEHPAQSCEQLLHAHLL